jgi:sulfonate transport system permease protein
MMEKLPSRILLSILVPACIILFWEFAVRFAWVPKTLIASPLDVLLSLTQMVWNGDLLLHVRTSLIRLGFGFIFGAAIGISFGIVVATSRLGSRLFEPTILGLIPVPPIAWIPLLIVLLGIGELSKVALIAIGSFCTLFIHSAHATREADSKLIELSHAFGKSKTQILCHILIPSAIPTIAASARVAMALSWTLLLCSEIIASSKGLGWLIWDSRNFSRPDDMIAGMVVVGVLGKASDIGIQLIEHRLTRWKSTYGTMLK